MLYESVCIFTGMLSIIITLLVNLFIETSGKNTTNIGFHSGSWKIFHEIHIDIYICDQLYWIL